MASIPRLGLRRSGPLLRAAAALKPTGSLAYHRPAAPALLDLPARARGPLAPGRPLLLRNLSVSLKPSDVILTREPDKQSTATATDEAAAAADMREGTRSMVHFKLSPNRHPLNVPKLDPNEKVWENPTHHSVWTKEEVDGVRITHLEASDWTSKVAYGIAQTLRFTFDVLAGFKTRKATEAMYLNRIVFLETVAGVPGMVAGMVRHLHSLRRMKRDHGWIHTLLEEAENERMHLLTFMQLKKPGPLFRFAVVGVQGAFFTTFFCAYFVNPKICHRLVGYIEEEAVKTYTHILEEMDAGELPLFNHIAPPPIAMSYWKLAPDATFRDLILAVRMDEATHREVNHTFANLRSDDYNPYVANASYHAQVKEVEQKKK